MGAALVMDRSGRYTRLDQVDPPTVHDHVLG
jgi:hypothetical protein